jgi:hypothetical protein
MINTLHVTTKEYEDRRSACLACEFYNPQTKSCGTFLPVKLLKLQGADLVKLEGRQRKVRLCGCFLPAKWKLTFASCPLPAEHKRWDRTVTKEQIQEVKRVINSEQGTRKWVKEMFDTYNATFSHKEKDSSLGCGKCLQRMKNQMIELIDKA